MTLKNRRYNFLLEIINKTNILSIEELLNIFYPELINPNNLKTFLKKKEYTQNELKKLYFLKKFKNLFINTIYENIFNEIMFYKANEEIKNITKLSKKLKEIYKNDKNSLYLFFKEFVKYHYSYRKETFLKKFPFFDDFKDYVYKDFSFINIYKKDFDILEKENKKSLKLIDSFFNLKDNIFELPIILKKFNKNNSFFNSILEELYNKNQINENLKIIFDDINLSNSTVKPLLFREWI